VEGLFAALPEDDRGRLAAELAAKIRKAIDARIRSDVRRQLFWLISESVAGSDGDLSAWQ